jgi:flagellar protein FlgJ
MIQTPDINGGLVLDARGLDALRLQARQNPDQALKGVSRQFEAVFLHMLLKSMRDATPKDGLMDSDQTRAYTSMLDQQMAQSLSAKGIGLADVMLRQLARNRASVAGAPAQPAAANVSAAETTPATASNPGKVKSGASQRGQDFLMRMKQHAIEASNATGIPTRFLLGQAALESGWGKHEIRTADGTRSFNLFGIKAGRNWNGATVQAMTTEYVDGAPRKVLQTFRAYASYAQAFQDYADLMRGNRRYAAVLKQNDSTGFAQGLQRAGYATDPLYAAKLTNILNGPRMQRTIMA